MKNKKILLKILLVVLFVVMFVPLWFMFVGSMQNLNGVMRMPPKLFPYPFFLNNYLSFLDYPLMTWFKNTVWSLFVMVVISVFISSSTGYFFATTNFKFKEVFFAILLIGMLMPRISFLIPQYIILKKIHLSGMLIGVVLSSAYTSYGILLARNYFESIPKSLFEAAAIDGANDWDILFHIVLPITPPAIATLALSTSIFYLSDFIWQMLVLQNDKNMTLLIGMIKTTMQIQFSGSNGINPLGRMMAVGIILLIPLVIIFLIANKYFTSSRGGEIKE